MTLSSRMSEMEEVKEEEEEIQSPKFAPVVDEEEPPHEFLSLEKIRLEGEELEQDNSKMV